MAATYSITEAQSRLPAILKEAEEMPILITRRDKVVGYLLSPERMEGILETLELLGNPSAMREIRRAKAGKGDYFPLSSLDEPLETAEI